MNYKIKAIYLLWRYDKIENNKVWMTDGRQLYQEKEQLALEIVDSRIRLAEHIKHISVCSGGVLFVLERDHYKTHYNIPHTNYKVIS